MITDAPSPFASTGLAADARSVPTRQPGGRVVPSTFWSGVGLANFATARTSATSFPQASEEIRDPHNMVLESLGRPPASFAMLALVLSPWGFGLRRDPPGSRPRTLRATAVRTRPKPVKDDLIPEPPLLDPAGWWRVRRALGWLAGLG